MRCLRPPILSNGGSWQKDCDGQWDLRERTTKMHGGVMSSVMVSCSGTGKQQQTAFFWNKKCKQLCKSLYDDFALLGLLSFAFNLFHATFSHANTPHLLKCYTVYHSHLCLPIREGTRWLFPHYLEGKIAVSDILQYKLNSCLKDLKFFFEKPGCICTLIHMWSLSRVQQLCTVLPHWISNTIIIAWHHCSILGSIFWCNLCSTISKLARYIATHFCSIYKCCVQYLMCDKQIFTMLRRKIKYFHSRL